MVFRRKNKPNESIEPLRTEILEKRERPEQEAGEMVAMVELFEEYLEATERKGGELSPSEKREIIDKTEGVDLEELATKLTMMGWVSEYRLKEIEKFKREIEELQANEELDPKVVNKVVKSRQEEIDEIRKMHQALEAYKKRDVGPIAEIFRAQYQEELERHWGADEMGGTFSFVQSACNSKRNLNTIEAMLRHRENNTGGPEWQEPSLCNNCGCLVPLGDEFCVSCEVKRAGKKLESRSDEKLVESEEKLKEARRSVEQAFEKGEEE